MTSNIDKIIERVQKLLALAGNNSNENEAAAAIEKAHAILAAHNLSMLNVQAHTTKIADEENERGALATDTNFSEKYYGWIWRAVAEANYCRVFMQRPNPKMRQTFYTVVGRKVNALVASQMATYLCQTVRRLTNEAAKTEGRGDHAFKNAYLAGIATRLYHRVTEMAKNKAEAVEVQNALVLWTGDEQAANDKFIKDMLKTDLKQSKGRTGKHDADGYLAGFEAGNKISLNQQVENKATETKALR